MIIILQDCRDAREYEEAKKTEKTRQLILRRLRGDGRYAECKVIVWNGSHRRYDPAAENPIPTAPEPQIKIAHVRATASRTKRGKRKRIYISLIPGYLFPKLRTASKVVASAVEKRAKGMSFQRIASDIDVIPRTVASWIRRLERAKERLARSRAKGSLAKAARMSMQKFFRALHRANVLVLAKLLADGIVI